MDIQEFRLAVLHRLISDMKDVSKIRLQKLSYLLQEFQGLPTGYPFKMHHYGPYSESLETDTARLRITGYVDIQPDQKGCEFHITPKDSPLESWEQLVEPYDEVVNWALETFGKWPTHRLELGATIHFVQNILHYETKENILNTVQGLKPKFSRDYINTVTTELEQLLPVYQTT